jgi:hypothetical protein
MTDEYIKAQKLLLDFGASRLPSHGFRRANRHESWREKI